MGHSHCVKNIKFTIALALAFMLFSFPLRAEEESPTDYPPAINISIVKGDLETIKTEGLTRVSITNPEVADATKIEGDRIVMLAKASGQTTVFLWDKHGKRSAVIHVSGENLNLLQARLEKLLLQDNLSGIKTEINQEEGKVVLSGRILESEKADFDKLISPFADNVMNLVYVEDAKDDLVQIDAQIVELSSSFSKNMGIEWKSALTWGETVPAVDSKADLFKIGFFSRTTPITATINALITEGKGHVLSKPKLVCLSGKEAKFLVGGQIPITTTTTTSGGNVQSNVEFKSYGVNLTINPTIRDGKIDIILGLDINDIDSANAVGNNVAFTTRSAQTQLYLENGQTVVLAGLIKRNDGESIKRIPFLSDIPVIGAVFRSYKNVTPNSETELVITLTPTILTHRADEKMETTAQSVPTQEIVEAAPAPVAVAEAVPQKVQSPAEEEKQVLEASDKINLYARSIQEQIANNIVYPDEAKSHGWSGSVKLSLRILRDGTLEDIQIKEPSGYDLFDRVALNAAKGLAPYASFPEDLDLKEVTVTVPIVYSLSDN